MTVVNTLEMKSTEVQTHSQLQCRKGVCFISIYLDYNYVYIIVISISIVLLSLLYVTKQFTVLVSCTHYQCVELYASIICECVSLCDECVFTLVHEHRELTCKK